MKILPIFPTLSFYSFTIFIKKRKPSPSFTSIFLSRTMCFVTECASCKKPTWGGCGKHLQGMFAGKTPDQICACKETPVIFTPLLLLFFSF